MSFMIDSLWYGRHPLRWLLLPCSWIYQGIIWVRRWYLTAFCQVPCPVPVIVVGNLTVGGVGKTPLVVALAKNIRDKGLSVGIVSRGYGATLKHFPHEITPYDNAHQVGDEPLMIAQKTQCPVVIAPNRVDAVAYLLKKHAVDIIISDDGLQHYRMGRSVEIAVIDGMRGLGNEACLPAGPLREPKARLQKVDLVVVNQGVWPNAHTMKITPGPIRQVATDAVIAQDVLTNSIAAVAAIGNPHRFYATLRQLGLDFSTHSFPDHYKFRPEDIPSAESLVIMTEKDAVKCRSFASDRVYYLPIEASLDDAFWAALWSHQHLQGYC